MKMSTRCPACGTAFRIQPHHLAARDGQVRCGKCATVFDARSTLATEDEPAAVPAAAPVPPPVATPSHAPHHSEALAQVEALAAQPVVTMAAREPEISVSDDEPDADFEFGPRARRRSRLVAAAWGAGAFAAALALAGQLGYAYRGELGLALPESQPWLEAACQRLGCTIPPPRRAELLSIETSELAAERTAPGVLTLTAALRNRAGFAQAYPHLELTLTDAADQPLARRVIAPREYAGTASAGFAAGAEQPVRLHIDAAGLNAKGYRIFLFHPR